MLGSIAPLELNTFPDPQTFYLLNDPTVKPVCLALAKWTDCRLVPAMRGPNPINVGAKMYFAKFMQTAVVFGFAKPKRNVSGFLVSVYLYGAMLKGSAS